MWRSWEIEEEKEEEEEEEKEEKEEKEDMYLVISVISQSELGLLYKSTNSKMLSLEFKTPQNELDTIL